MAKSTVTYWNPLRAVSCGHLLKGLKEIVEELTLSINPVTGGYTRLTRFLPGADTSSLGGKTHPYPEEGFVVSGHLYDEAFDLWLEAGHYVSVRDAQPPCVATTLPSLRGSPTICPASPARARR